MDLIKTATEMHACELVKTTAQNLGAGVAAPVVFTDVDVFDPHAWHDPAGANPERITVTEAGLYAVTTYVAFAAAAADADLVDIQVDGASIKLASGVQVAAGGAIVVSSVEIGQIAAGSYIQIEATSSGGGAPAITAAGLRVYKIADART